MTRMVFCNIGWMGRYQGWYDQPDKIVGGGSWVRENGTGNETCNFQPCEDGFVYGHVETISGDKDRQIHIEKWGGDGESLSGIDLIWTATHPQEGGRRVIGWYRDATIFRKRQFFERWPSEQHRLDDINNYRIRTLAENAYLLDLEERKLSMPTGTGWMGQTPWWSPPDSSEDRSIQEFIQSVHEVIDDQRAGPPHGGGLGSDRTRTKNSPDTPRKHYVRYVQEHEIQISPRHNQLQGEFESFLAAKEAMDVQPNKNRVDLQYYESTWEKVLVEIKPCDSTNARYAIRTAMGQLLDYRQCAEGDKLSLLIVIETKPSKVDQDLATSNGFGIGYRANGTFTVVWPTP